MNSFAKRLEVLLEEKDMKQNELAKRIGVSEVTISRYMTADRKPRTDIATKISKELGVSTDYLLGESNTRNPEQPKEPAPVTDVEEAMKIILDQPGLMLKGNIKETTLLVIDEKEMEFVKFLYEKYLELGSLHQLEIYTHQNNIKSHSGRIFEKSTMKIILQNPVYVKANIEVVEYLKRNDWDVFGETDGIHSLLTYNKTENVVIDGKVTKAIQDPSNRFAAVSKVKGAIDPKLWLDVQRQFDKNRSTFPRLGKTHNVLLTGKIRCGDCDSYMQVIHGRINKETGKKRFYYGLIST